MKESYQQKIVSLLIYIFTCLLMVEWLKPVMELTDTDHLSLFVFYLAISFFFYFIKLDWKLAIPIKLLFICWIIVYIYTDYSFFSKVSLDYLGVELLHNFSAIFSQEWGAITDPFRTFLFFVLLWMTTYLLNYWIRVRKTLLLFFILTVLFITILDAFSPYSGKDSIVTTLISGFIIMGLLYIQKLLVENNISLIGTFITASIGSLILLLAISGITAYALPKAGPIWPDPVPFFTTSTLEVDEREGGVKGTGGIKKVGYGENDEQLGGAFQSDDTPIFWADVNTQQYWKVETKDTYTSKGWIQSESEVELQNFGIGEIFESDIPPGEDNLTTDANIVMAQDFPLILQPYGIKSIQTNEEAMFTRNPLNQKISVLNSSNSSLWDYNVSFSEPTYSLKALRATNTESLNSLSSDFDRYLQLPDTLPDRVRELAVSITQDKSSLYDKANSIERYFRSNSFSYNQTMAAIPDKDTDYVDQFLFDTKVGYCDNFSTSMVVLLRSIDIPARWVKGFAPGDRTNMENLGDVYEVTNNNAHSWVEAYFPNVGWITFEPTIGFSSSANIVYDVEKQTDELLTPEEQQETPKSEGFKKEDEVSFSFTAFLQTIIDWISEKKVTILWFVIILGILSLFAYIHRGKWLSKVLIPTSRLRKNDWNSFEKMYHQLLRQLSRRGLVREQGQTLMDFARKVDKDFGDTHMIRLTKAYQQGFYGNNKTELNYASIRESWEYLINQLSG
ncbi:transglutaminase [Psychrobacillus sp. AK 1817]|uniref:DUF4129 domain-containing transglutaminase family protein n=1 Tax=Psychrobacillus sp. AK 1817 TaxID=2303505 RepID=UPI001243C9AC|nr:transglutaminase domain-containing protein [Psychrobacillus sp. AK 1817]QEY22077.1 transglutaminase [Psychrobacillus sp. AK 1817]